MSLRSKPDTDDAVALIAGPIEKRPGDGSESVAREILNLLLENGWRPPPRRLVSPSRRGVPPNAEYRAEKAAAFGTRTPAEGGQS